MYKSPENTIESEQCQRKMKMKCCGRVKEKVLLAGEPGAVGAGELSGGADILAGLERHM